MGRQQARQAEVRSLLEAAVQLDAGERRCGEETWGRGGDAGGAGGGAGGGARTACRGCSFWRPRLFLPACRRPGPLCGHRVAQRVGGRRPRHAAAADRQLTAAVPPRPAGPGQDGGSQAHQHPLVGAAAEHVQGRTAGARAWRAWRVRVARAASPSVLTCAPSLQLAPADACRDCLREKLEGIVAAEDTQVGRGASTVAARTRGRRGCTPAAPPALPHLPISPCAAAGRARPFPGGCHGAGERRGAARRPATCLPSQQALAQARRVGCGGRQWPSIDAMEWSMCQRWGAARAVKHARTPALAPPTWRSNWLKRSGRSMGTVSPTSAITCEHGGLAPEAGGSKVRRLGVPADFWAFLQRSWAAAVAERRQKERQRQHKAGSGGQQQQQQNGERARPCAVQLRPPCALAGPRSHSPSRHARNPPLPHQATWSRCRTTTRWW